MLESLLLSIYAILFIRLAYFDSQYRTVDIREVLVSTFLGLILGVISNTVSILIVSILFGSYFLFLLLVESKSSHTVWVTNILGSSIGLVDLYIIVLVYTFLIEVVLGFNLESSLSFFIISCISYLIYLLNNKLKNKLKNLGFNNGVTQKLSKIPEGDLNYVQTNLNTKEQRDTLLSLMYHSRSSSSREMNKKKLNLLNLVKSVGTPVYTYYVPILLVLLVVRTLFF